MSQAIKKKRAAGRTALDGASNVERATITLEQPDRDKLRLLGGSPWVRRKIREADVVTDSLLAHPPD